MKSQKLLRVVSIFTMLSIIISMFSFAFAADTENTNVTEVPLLVIIASFDADGDGENDYDDSDRTKLFADTSSPVYGEQWAYSKPEEHYQKLFDENYTYSLINFYKEMTLGRVYYVPAEFDKDVPGQTIQKGVMSIVIKRKHPGASNDAGGTISAIIKATDEYIDYKKFDTNGDGKVTQKELGIAIMNAGADHAYTGTYANTSYPKGYFAVHGTSQGCTVTLDGVKITSGSSKGNVSNFGEYSTPGTLMPIGVIAHELAHNLGAEDLYYRNPGYGGTAITGWPMPYRFSLQCTGNSCGNSAKPAYLDPYQRIYLGFADCEVVGDGEHTLYSTCSGKYKVLRYNTPDPNEYYLIEVRLKEGFETGLLTGSEGGIMVWHIDESINGKYFAGGNADTYYFCEAGATSPHDPGIVPLFRTGWNELGTRMLQTNPADPCYYKSADPKTAVFDSSNFRSATNGTISLNSYPANWVGQETYNVHIEVLSEPGQEMKIKISSEMNAVFKPDLTVSSPAQTKTSITLLGSIASANGEKISDIGFIISEKSNPTRENGTFIPAKLNDDGKTFTAVAQGLEMSKRYYFVSCASNENGEGQSTINSITTSGEEIERTYFTVKMYKNINGKNKNLTEKNVNFGETLTYSFPMDSSVKRGYVFVGWFTDEDLTEPYDMNYTQDHYGIITLYAKWVEEGTETSATTAYVTTAATESQQITTPSGSSSGIATETTSGTSVVGEKGIGTTLTIIIICASAVLALCVVFFCVAKKKMRK